jgi:orotidine-5'-phosphate decarboxylase
MSVKAPRVIVALDYSDSQSALSLVDQLDPTLCRLKVGKELFTRCGPEIVRSLVDRKFDVFLDLKFHDIPNTVARACAAAADLGVWMLNVHALGGPAMLDAARKALSGPDSPLLIAVTLLTSSGPRELEALGISQTPLELVQRLATMAAIAGLDGVVCSSQEAAMLARQHGDDFVLVTPGIRLQGAAEDDQQRVMTPARAVAQGAHYLVIGRPIVQADDPVQTLLTINSEISDS